MVKVTIYQAPFIQTCMGFSDSANYKQVWVELHNDSKQVTPDFIWRRFQRVDDDMMPPAGYEGRSLSIGDVIGIGRDMFSPMPVGWYKLSDDERMLVEIQALTTALADSFNFERKP